MEGKDKKQQVIIKICCIIASFMLWLYISNVENPIRTYKLGYVPVQFVNKGVLKNSKLSIIPGEENYVTLTLKGPASKVYTVKPEQFKLVVDLEKYALKKGENKIPVEIKKIPDGVSVVNNDNLWVKVKLDSLEERQVPINITLFGKPKEGFYALKPTTKYKFAKVIGPATYVNQVHEVVGKCNVKNSDLDFQAEVPLKAVNSAGNVIENVYVSPSFVKTNINIKNKKLVKININTIGDIGSSNIKNITTMPESIEIIGDSKEINKINTINTEPIYLENLKSNEINTKLIIPKDISIVNDINTVKLKIEFKESIATKEINDINVILKNENSEYTNTLNQNTISIVVSGKESVLNSLNNNKISSYVDLSSLSEGEHNVPINVNLPEGVSKVDIKPQYVKVTIKRKGLEGNNGNKNK